jgi:hypothetical protein
VHAPHHTAQRLHGVGQGLQHLAQFVPPATMDLHRQVAGFQFTQRSHGIPQRTVIDA